MLSPHLDDAVFSVGAALHRAAKRGAEVVVLTVFAGDPESQAPAGEWDRRSGFVTAGQAAAVRREEDRRACALIGAQPRWLAFDFGPGNRPDERVIWEELAGLLDGADIVLAPGFPLQHPDHVVIERLVRTNRLPSGRLLFYLEQPYALWQAVVARPETPWIGSDSWRRLDAHALDRWTKLRACREYRSQLPLLGPRLLSTLSRYEASHGGEAAAWPDSETPTYPESHDGPR